MTEGIFAIVHSVEEKKIGSDSSAAFSGATIPLDDADWAAEEGGKLYINGVHPLENEEAAYTGVNYDTNTLTGVTGVTSWPEDTFVEPRPRQWEKYAEVWPEGAEFEDNPGPIVCRVANPLVDRLFRGTRAPDVGERAFIERRGPEYVLYELIGESGDVVIWQYTSKVQIADSYGISFFPPYAAVMKEARAVIEEPGSTNTEVTIRFYDSGDFITQENMVIPSGSSYSNWVKLKDDDGWEVDEDYRVYCEFSPVGTGAVGPGQVQIRAIPRGAA